MATTFCTEMTREQHDELIQLSEETDFPKLIDHGLGLLTLCLRFMAKGYRIAAVPVNEAEKQDLSRPITFINVASIK